MAALYSHTTRATGLTLTAAIYNSDHQNHIDNGVPLQQDDYSSSVGQMQTSTDPVEVGSESLATTQAGEFERLRFTIRELKGEQQWYETSTGSTKRNLIYNGGFRVAQRGTSFTSATTPANNDDTWLLDRWLLLSDGNDAVDVTQSTTAPTGAINSIALDVETGNKKFGIVQILEEKDAALLQSQTVSLSFQARTSGSITIDHLRAGVVSWTSTADSVTSDIVSAWEAAGTNPTLVANWAFDNTPASLATLTTSFQKFSVENISIAAGANNIAVFIWIDDVTTTVGEVLNIAEVQLEVGGRATPFERRTFALEHYLCDHYYQRYTFGSANSPFATAQANTTTTGEGAFAFRNIMRSAPTVTFSGATDFEARSAGGIDASTAIAGANISVNNMQISITVAAGLVQGDALLIRSDATVDRFMELDSEL